jgi:hypothetical protein
VEKSFVTGAKTDEFVNACLLQFPYGVGGMNDKREKPDGSFKQEMACVSNPTFQSPMFTLILYSLKCKELGIF